jgi:hypothetical protein
MIWCSSAGHEHFAPTLIGHVQTDLAVVVGTFAGRQLGLERRRSRKGRRLLRSDWRQQAALRRQTQLLAYREQRLPEHVTFAHWTGKR